MRRWLLLLALPGCAVSARAGPEARVQAGDPIVAAQGTLMVGFGEPTPYTAFGVPLTVSAGGITNRAEARTDIESGLEYATDVYGAFGFRLGPRIGGAIEGPSGVHTGLRGGPMVRLGETRLSLELFGGYGFAGAIAGDAIFGASLSFGFDYAKGIGNLPSGRPFRDAAGAEQLAPLTRGDAAEPLARAFGRLSRGERQREGRRWLADARSEHASIAAFAQLAADLARHAAPPTLVARAHVAAFEEAGHAHACFRIANAYLDDALAPGPWRAPPIASTRAELAFGSLRDGAYGEGLAAREALARRASHPYVARTLRRIAREEQGHAELAWDVLAFCLRDERTRPALVEGWRATKASLDPAMVASVDARLGRVSHGVG